MGGGIPNHGGKGGGVEWRGWIWFCWVEGVSFWMMVILPFEVCAVRYRMRHLSAKSHLEKWRMEIQNGGLKILLNVHS